MSRVRLVDVFREFERSAAVAAAAEAAAAQNGGPPPLTLSGAPAATGPAPGCLGLEQLQALVRRWVAGCQRAGNADKGRASWLGPGKH